MLGSREQRQGGGVQNRHAEDYYTSVLDFNSQKSLPTVSSFLPRLNIVSDTLRLAEVTLAKQTRERTPPPSHLGRPFVLVAQALSLWSC